MQPERLSILPSCDEYMRMPTCLPVSPQGLPVPTQTCTLKGYEPRQPTFVKPLRRLQTPTMSANVTRSPIRKVRLLK